MSTRHRLLKVLAVIAIVVLVFVIAFAALHLAESSLVKKNPVGEQHVSKTIIRDGVAYYPRQDITTVLLMGIDDSGEKVGGVSYRNDGHADVLLLAVLDDTSKTYNIISINRDSMVTMPVLGIGGRPADTRYGQIALSHTYGGGLEDSCENVKKTVSDLLCGIGIDYYAAMNMDGVPVLNDAVGGVEVEVVDDFSGIDDTIAMGTVVLEGEQALNFVRIRMGVGDQLNLSRMDRQKAFMEGFIDKIRGQSDRYLLDLYDTVSDYVVTDCNGNAMADLASRFAEYTLDEIVYLKGENVKGEVFMEYHLDEDALDQMTIELLYEPKK